DAVTTVSPTYAAEIRTPEKGCGLDGVLRTRRDGVVGILNGLDEEIWDPATDKFLEAKYSAQDDANKAINKEKLQERMGLPRKKDVPVFGFVGRLTHQKGVDLILDSITHICQKDAQVVILGIGEGKYHHILNALLRRHPQKMAIHLVYNDPLSHMVYAGSDFFLMPSVFEPCGLSQMISLRYGTVPLVFQTGGLADTIVPFPGAGANGLMFKKYETEEFIRMIDQALQVYRNPSEMNSLVKNAFATHFVWDEAAEQYAQVYQRIKN
ncbi:MAG: glycogen synthase, partial [Candidatus Omnitrophica bacterium]|nr:glycogen synthase [Candidatus Omnitrophota bacterium]